MKLVNIIDIAPSYLFEVWFEGPEEVWVISPKDTDKKIWKIRKDGSVRGWMNTHHHLGKESFEYLNSPPKYEESHGRFYYACS